MQAKFKNIWKILSKASSLHNKVGKFIGLTKNNCFSKNLETASPPKKAMNWPKNRPKWLSFKIESTSLRRLKILARNWKPKFLSLKQNFKTTNLSVIQIITSRLFGSFSRARQKCTVQPWAHTSVFAIYADPIWNKNLKKLQIPSLRISKMNLKKSSWRCRVARITRSAIRFWGIWRRNMRVR